MTRRRDLPALRTLAAATTVGVLLACSAQETTPGDGTASASVPEEPPAEMEDGAELDTWDDETTGPQSGPTARWRVASLAAEPLAFVPAPGQPPGRIGVDPRVAALVPETVTLTMESRPTVFWYLPEPSDKSLILTLMDRETNETVFGKQLFAPLSAGFYSARTTRLERDRISPLPAR